MKTKEDVYKEIIFRIFLLLVISFFINLIVLMKERDNFELADFTIAVSFSMLPSFFLLFIPVLKYPQLGQSHTQDPPEIIKSENIRRAWRISARFTLIYNFLYWLFILILKTWDKQIYFRWYPTRSLPPEAYETHFHWFLGLNPIINLPVIMIFGISIWLLIDFLRNLNPKENYFFVKLCLAILPLAVLIIGVVYGTLTGRFLEALVNFGILGLVLGVGFSALSLVVKFIGFMFTKDPWIWLLKRGKEFVEWFVS